MRCGALVDDDLRRARRSSAYEHTAGSSSSSLSASATPTAHIWTNILCVSVCVFVLVLGRFSAGTGGVADKKNVIRFDACARTTYSVDETEMTQIRVRRESHFFFVATFVAHRGKAQRATATTTMRQPDGEMACAVFG